MGTPGYQSGWLVERPGNPHGDFEIVVTCRPPFRGLAHLSHDRALAFAAQEIWNEAERIRSSSFTGPFTGASMILSNYGNLEIVASQVNGALAHFCQNGIFGWRGPVFLPGRGAGPPAFIQSGFGKKGNFEVIVPRPGGGLSHFWRDNDGGDVWHEAPQPARRGNWSGIALIHSNFGNLEAVGVRDKKLVFFWQNGAGGVWSASKGLGFGFRGRPAFIQSSYGTRGNFEVIAAKADGQLAQYWRNNDQANFPWSQPVMFGRGSESEYAFDDVTMIQSTFSRLEVIAHVASSRAFLHYRAALGAAWEGPIQALSLECEA